MGLFKWSKDVHYEEKNIFGHHVLVMTVCNEEAGKRLNRAVGDYYTIEVGTPLHELMEMRNLCECLVAILETALEPLHGKRLLIVGLGNPNDPADALGPEVTRFMPLRFLAEYFKDQGRFENVIAYTPGVAMNNNLATEMMVKGMVEASRADGLVLIDSEITKDYSHLFSVIEVSTAGGFSSHIGDVQADWSSLGIPVVSVGVPMAMPGDYLLPGEAGKGSIFTESRVGDVMISARAIITYALIRVGWPEIPQSQCYAFSKIMKDPTSLVGGTFFLGGEE